MNNLLVVIPFCSKDHANASILLRWMAELQPDGYAPHSCLLASDAIVPTDIQKEIYALAKPQFEHTELLRIPVPDDRQNWIAGSNFMFEQVSRTISSCMKLPWLWCEPDCVPLKYGWLDSLAEGYAACPRRFMGAHVKAVNQPNLPPLHLAGCSVYDADVYTGMKEFVQQTTLAFDIASASFTVNRSINTPLIQHFWGKPNLAPTFRETKAASDPENTVPMGYIRPDAAIWHRCKDGSLINCLRARRQKVLPHTKPEPKPEPAPEPVSVPDPAPSPVSPSPETEHRGPGRPRKNPVMNAINELFKS